MPRIHPFAAPSADPASSERGGGAVEAALRAIAAGARVIGVGEAAHSVAEVQAVQGLVVRALLDSDGGSGTGAAADGPVAVIALESGFAEALELDAWVGGAGSERDLASVAERGMTYGFGASPWMQRLLALLRERNRREPGGRVRVVGLDLPGSGTSPGPAARVCLAAVDARAGDADLQRRADLGGRTEAAIAYAGLSGTERSALVRDLRGLVGRVRVAADAVRGASSVSGPDPAVDPAIALRAAASLEAFLDELEYDADEAAPDAPYPRERFMAETALWAAERYGRTVVLAHNAHVRREPLHGRPTLGGLVAGELGDAYRVIATAYASGPAVRFVSRSPRPFDCDVVLEHRVPAPGTVEAALERVIAVPPGGAALVDLRGMRSSGSGDAERDPRPDLVAAISGVTGMHAGADLDPVEDFSGAFDAIVHLGEAHRVPGAFERLEAEFGASRSKERR